MEGFCRGCLIRYDDPMELLHYTEKYRRLFVYSTGLQIKRNDTITFQLCKDCFLSMKAACKFKKVCRSSDRKLKSFLTLKDVGDGIDLSSFLKNNDDTMTFRLPLMSGSSTPANQKSRDDDNESTCTSIRNFMTDILQGEEVSNTEARIIREVIEEEADLLDDSLDSHWLQDDATIDTDFRLDFSFSPFATPQSVNNDHYSTPKRQDSQEEQPRKYFSSISPARHTANDFTDFIKNNQSEKELCVFNPKNDELHNNLPLPINDDNDKSVNDSNSNDSGTLNNDFDLAIANEKSMNTLYLPSIDSERSMSNLDLPSIGNEALTNNLDLPSLDSEKSMNNLDLPSLPSIENEKSVSNLDLPIIDNIGKNYVSNYDGSNFISTSNEIERIVENKMNKSKTCVIDKNLEKALKDECNKEFSLEDVLRTPRALRNSSAASTPTIANILFGDMLNLDEDIKKVKKNNHNEGFIDDIFENNSKEVYTKAKEVTNEDSAEMDTKDKSGIKEVIHTKNMQSDDEKFDLEKIFCKLCDKKYQTIRALSIHFTKKHNIKIVKPRQYYVTKSYVCNMCGAELKSRQILHRHMKRFHIKAEREVFKCDICSLEFTLKTKMEQHINSHYGKITEKVPGKFLCTICGASSTTIGNFRLHQKRHTDNYSHKCKECDKGFFRQSDLNVHMRKHTGEKPFHCEYCDTYFSRKDFLTQHVKLHIGNKPHQCQYCELKFTTRSVLNLHLKTSKKCKHKRELLYQTSEIENEPTELNELDKDMDQLHDIYMDDELRNPELPYIETEISN